MFSSVKHIHFVGIGGIGMSGIAEILLSQGFTVSGSDTARSDNTEYLQSLGATVHIGHAAENIAGAEAVVYSSAVEPDANPETIAAMQLKVPVIRRAEMLAEVSRLNYCLAVAGTHGKTTTTSMAGLVLMNAGIDPTVIVGGRLRGLGGSNARLGKGQWTVVEADEYDRSFLQLLPTVAVVTNIEAEHLDIYADIDDIKRTFIEFVNKVPFYGAVVACMDDTGVRDIMHSINKKVVTYGFSPHSDVRAVNTTYAERTSECTVYAFGKEVGVLRLNIPGKHNVSNALAAVAAGLQLGVPFESIAHALAEFHGVLRRFEIVGERDGVIVVDDYAHHHTEVQATLKAAKSGWNRRVVAVFQPHTYTRTRDFIKEFAVSFDDADEVIVTDVYGSREKPIEGITGELIANAIRSAGHRHVHYVQDKAIIPEYLTSVIQSGDMLITLGAGDVNKAGKAFLNGILNKDSLS
ncbi:MAG: UDP-N-acetylmuramate--L-alanine ligase [Candidatus Kapabacteria bacterium]|nr:UDP-N-acetylmuramate--L-alanine ligase [Candidatus Kapabacteria bacterium]